MRSRGPESRRPAMHLAVEPRWIELGGILAALLLALAIPRAFRPVYRRARRALDWMAARPARSIGIAAAAAGLGSAAVAILVQWPTPRVHDEFSYLMAADTFAHGRLSNPTHPMWRHLETFHVFFEPVYASKYPPGQGLWLAFGQALFGEPAVSLWLGAAILCGSLAWMFFAWLPPRWAALAALLATLQLGIASYWTQSYWGGAVAATGGALAYGALPRLIAHARARHAFVLALGLAILANSRPFEGLVASVPIVVALAILVFRTKSARAPVIVPVALVMTACVAWIAHYNRSITGSAALMPYWIHDKLYTLAPPFLWMPLSPEPHYNHAALRAYWTGFGLEEYTRQMDFSRLGESLAEKFLVFWRFYVGFLWSVPCILVLFALRDRRVRLAAACVAFFFVVLLGATYTLAHYAAPVAGLIIVLVAAGLRRLSVVHTGDRAIGRAAVVCLCVAGVGSLGAQIVLRKRPHDAWDQVRARMQAELEVDPAPDLVLVRYGDGHDPHDEWVFNAADIDASPVVWARDMGSGENRELIEYFRDRRAWRLEVDAGERVPQLVPYSP